MNNPWCESCSSKNICYTSITRPKCYTPITNIDCRGLEHWVSYKLDSVIKEYKDEIIDAAADKLAERLARTKRAKEIIKEE